MSEPPSERAAWKALREVYTAIDGRLGELELRATQDAMLDEVIRKKDLQRFDHRKRGYAPYTVATLRQLISYHMRDRQDKAQAADEIYVRGSTMMEIAHLEKIGMRPPESISASGNSNGRANTQQARSARPVADVGGREGDTIADAADRASVPVSRVSNKKRTWSQTINLEAAPQRPLRLTRTGTATSSSVSSELSDPPSDLDESAAPWVTAKKRARSAEIGDGNSNAPSKRVRLEMDTPIDSLVAGHDMGDNLGAPGASSTQNAVQSRQSPRIGMVWAGNVEIESASGDLLTGLGGTGTSEAAQPDDAFTAQAWHKDEHLIFVPKGPASQPTHTKDHAGPPQPDRQKFTIDDQGRRRVKGPVRDYQNKHEEVLQERKQQARQSVQNLYPPPLPKAGDFNQRELERRENVISMAKSAMDSLDSVARSFAVNFCVPNELEENEPAEFVPDPRPNLKALYVRVLGDQNWLGALLQAQNRKEPWTFYASFVLSSLMAAEVYEKVFLAKLPWEFGDALREALGEQKLTFMAESLDDSGYDFSEILKQWNHKMITSAEFQKGPVAERATVMAQELALTVSPHLSWLRWKQKGDEGRFGIGPGVDAAWVEHLQGLFEDALILKGKIETYSNTTFEWFWPDSGSMLDSKSMEPVNRSTGLEQKVIHTMWPGLIGRRRQRLDEGGEVFKVFTAAKAKVHSTFSLE